MEKLTVYIKEGKGWRESYTTTDALEVYKGLTDALISKKICKCTYIQSIKRVNLYNGTQKITVYHFNGCKAVYIVKN